SVFGQAVRVGGGRRDAVALDDFGGARRLRSGLDDVVIVGFGLGVDAVADSKLHPGGDDPWRDLQVDVVVAETGDSGPQARRGVHFFADLQGFVQVDGGFHRLFLATRAEVHK